MVGGSVTLTALMEAMHSLVKALPQHQTSTFRAMLEQLKYFAGVQIRNAASVAGNICTGSPISDVNPIYMACGAVFTTIGKGTPERQVPAQPACHYAGVRFCRFPISVTAASGLGRPTGLTLSLLL